MLTWNIKLDRFHMLISNSELLDEEEKEILSQTTEVDKELMDRLEEEEWKNEKLFEKFKTNI